MKKVLIYFYEDILNPIGGPAGYLFNLKNGLEKISNNEIQIDFLKSNSQVRTLRAYSKTSQNQLIKKMLRIYQNIKRVRTNVTLLKAKNPSSIDLNDYDAVHFHSTADLYKSRDELKDYKGKVLLNSHSPQPLSSEIIAASSAWEKRIFKKTYQRLIEIDKFAFERADNIIFPCESADEPYLNGWKEYVNIKENKKDQYRFLLTGTIPGNPQKSKAEVCELYGIPQDAYIISYVGRHNEIKGYDRLKAIGLEILKRHSNVYILVAGGIGPLEPPKHERWIEIGWTNDPHSIIKSSDVFVLPNKETYFDLVLLEVLSLGTLVVASNTGGNKYFKEEKGIKLFDSEFDAVKLIEEFMKKSSEEICELNESNKALFNTHFTTEVFAREYISVLQSIL